MSIDEQKEEIQNLLERLDDETLKKSHVSVLISFRQMFDYIENMIEPVKQKDIKRLLKIYKEMSQKYFVQFELSLLREIENRRTARNQCELAKKLIDSKALTEENEIKAMKVATELLDTNCGTVANECENLMGNFATHLQDALNKLTDEWQRLGTLAVASQALAKDHKLIRSLEAVVRVAAYSIGIEAQRIVVVPGREFALYFFTYLENFVVFTVPIYSVQAPWEWSIFWHELAGHQVRWLEQGTTIKSIGTKLRQFYEWYKALRTEKKKDVLLKVMMRGNQFGYDYLKKLFSEDKLDLSDLGSFDHQFEQILLRLPEKTQIGMYEKMKKDGWCVDWFKELFEDAWSVLTIREAFLIFLQDILSRHINIDGHHPPSRIRLGVAQELLRLSQPVGKGAWEESTVMFQLELSKDERTVVKIVSRQLLKFLSLIIAARYKFESPMGLVSQDAVRQDNKIFEDLQEWQIQDIFEGVRNTIQDAIVKWSGFHDADDPAEKARECVQDAIALFSNSEYVKTRVKKESLKASYEKLFKRENGEDKNYKELLELSFYDTDFGVSSVTNVYYNIYRKFDSARLQSVPDDVTMGAVTFECNGIRKKTSIESWNTAAVPGFEIT